MLADGGEAIPDLAVLRDQPDVFGAVASMPTAWRLLDRVGEDDLVELRPARASARERVSVLRADGWPGVATSNRCRGTDSRLVIDLDATEVTDAFGEGTDGRELHAHPRLPPVVAYAGQQHWRSAGRVLRP